MSENQSFVVGQIVTWTYGSLDHEGTVTHARESDLQVQELGDPGQLGTWRISRKDSTLRPAIPRPGDTASAALVSTAIDGHRYTLTIGQVCSDGCRLFAMPHVHRLNAPEAYRLDSLAVLRRAPTPEVAKGEESRHGFRRGDLVSSTVDRDGAAFRVVGPADDGSDWLLIEREDGIKNAGRSDGCFYGNPKLLSHRQPSPASGGSADPVAAVMPVSSEAGSPKADPYRKATIAQCMHRNADLARGFCDDCGSSTAEARVVDRLLNFLKWSDGQDAIVASRRHLDQHKADLDRGVATRGKYGARMPLKNPHWPSADEGEA